MGGVREDQNCLTGTCDSLLLLVLGTTQRKAVIHVIRLGRDDTIHRAVLSAVTTPTGQPPSEQVICHGRLSSCLSHGREILAGLSRWGYLRDLPPHQGPSTWRAPGPGHRLSHRPPPPHPTWAAPAPPEALNHCADSQQINIKDNRLLGVL